MRSLANLVYSTQIFTGHCHGSQTFILGRLFDRVHLIKPYIHPSIHKHFLWFQRNLVCWCTTVCSMTRSKVKVKCLLKLECGHFHKISSPPFTMGASNSPLILTYGTISKYDRAGFLIFVLFFVSHVFELGTICVYVRRVHYRPSAKCFFDFNDIWYVGRGWWVMHGGIQYDPMQGQGPCHQLLISKLGHNIWICLCRISDICPSFCHMYWWQPNILKSRLSKSTQFC